MAESNASGGLNSIGGMGGALFLVFLVLKLLDKIDWSWWWVTAPLWIPVGLAVVFLGVVVLVMTITRTVKGRKGR